MKNIKLIIVALIVLAGLMSCTTSKFTNLTVTTEALQGEVLGEFTTSVNVPSFLGSAAGYNYFNVTADAETQPVQDAILAEIEALGGTAAINVTIEHKAELMDILFNSFTGYIYAPSTVVVSGTVIK